MKAQLKILKLIHLALVIGLAIAYLLLGNLTNTDNLKLPTVTNDSLIYLLIPVIAFVLSNFMFRTLVSKIDSTLRLEEKFGAYQSASLVRWAIIEGAAFIILILKPDYLIFGLLLIAYLIFLMPTESKFKRDLNVLD